MSLLDANIVIAENAYILKHSLMAPLPKASFSSLTTFLSSLQVFLKALYRYLTTFSTGRTSR